MNPFPVEKMNGDQLWAGLLGAMAWQQIVQKNHGGPEASTDAALITGLYAKTLKDRELV